LGFVPHRGGVFRGMARPFFGEAAGEDLFGGQA
jgi:hypothetical protein